VDVDPSVDPMGVCARGRKVILTDRHNWHVTNHFPARNLHLSTFEINIIAEITMTMRSMKNKWIKY
jgi:hypothetical protein